MGLQDPTQVSCFCQLVNPQIRKEARQKSHSLGLNLWINNLKLWNLPQNSVIGAPSQGQFQINLEFLKSRKSLKCQLWALVI